MKSAEETKEEILELHFIRDFPGYRWLNVMATEGDWKKLLECALAAMEEYANQFKQPSPALSDEKIEEMISDWLDENMVTKFPHSNAKQLWQYIKTSILPLIKNEVK